MTNKSALTWIAPAGIILLCTAALAALFLRPVPTTSTERAPTLQVSLLERQTVVTAADWLTVADAVVTIRVTDEQRQTTPGSETEQGDGIRMIGRVVTVDVIDEVWSRPQSALPEPVPDTFVMSALGWATLPDSTEKLEVTARAASRLEVGRTYVVGLRWYPPACEGEGAAVGAWGPIGSGGIVPFTGSTLGVGELQGVDATLQEFRGHVAADSLRAEVAGRDIATLARMLKGETSRRDPGLDTPASCPR